MDILSSLSSIRSADADVDVGTKKQVESNTFDKFVVYLHTMVKEDLLNTLQYAYFMEFGKFGGSLINIRFFVDMVQQIGSTVQTEFDTEMKGVLGLSADPALSEKYAALVDGFDSYNTIESLRSDRAATHEIAMRMMGCENKQIQDVLTDREIKSLDTLLERRIKKLQLLERFKTICIAMFGSYFKYDDDGFRINKNIKYGLTHVSSIDFTVEQKKSLWMLYEFLINPDAHVFCFQGYAGTGKTTTIVELVSYLIKNSYIKSVAFTAPTNKAVSVMKNKFRPHLKSIVSDMFGRKIEDGCFCFDDELDYLTYNGLNIQFITIHKLMSFKTDYSVSGEMIFVRDSTPSMIQNFELVLIDECSMISMDMIDNIFGEIRLNQNTRSKGFKRYAKIVFSGDPAQLPPVNEDRSSIFVKTDDFTFGDYASTMKFKIVDAVMSDAESMMQHNYHKLVQDLSKMQMFLLKNVVRSRLDNVKKVCTEFRYLVVDPLYSMDKLADELVCIATECDGCDDTTVSDSKIAVPGVSLYNYDARYDRLSTEWFKHFMSSIKAGEASIILTWTNRQTDTYNDAIRNMIFGSASKSELIKKYEVGDILMLSEFYASDPGEDFTAQKLFTSEQIKVIQTDMKDVGLRKFEKITTKAYTNLKAYNKINPDLEMLETYLNDEFCLNKKVECWVLRVIKLEDHDYKKDGIDKSMSIVVISDKDRAAFSKAKSTSNDMIRNFSSKLLNRYKTAQQQITRAVIVPLWVQWRKIFDEPFANVNYGYSITTHKAQGSGFHNAYVDLNDILLNPKPDEAYKCAYTAVTRTSNELHILI